jgi:hypothetical protein
VAASEVDLAGRRGRRTRQGRQGFAQLLLGGSLDEPTIRRASLFGGSA